GGDLIHGAALPPAAKRIQQRAIGLGHSAQYTRNLEPTVATYGRRGSRGVAPSVFYSLLVPHTGGSMTIKRIHATTAVLACSALPLASQGHAMTAGDE